MSGGKYIKQAIVAALCDHPDKDKYSARAFSGEGLDKTVNALSNTPHQLTKADFLTPDENGVFIIDTPGFWKNFEQIRLRLAKSGEYFTADDFLTTLSKDRFDQARTLLNSAADHHSLAKVFSEDVWRGRFEEMQRLWYKAPLVQRKRDLGGEGAIPLPLKRKLYQAEGRKVPEDRLIAAGLSVADIHQAFSTQGKYDELKRRLSMNGDYLRKEYLLLPDQMGNTCFENLEAWNRYPDIAKTLAQRGEPMEVADFIRQIGNAQTILGRACEKQGQEKVFEPSLWTGRLESMLDLWSRMLPAWKLPMPDAKFHLFYAQAEDHTYGRLLDATRLSGKQDLLQPLGEGKSAVLPLALKTFWDNHAVEAAKELRAAGQPIMLADLRQPSGALGHSCLMTAAKLGHFRTVVDMARLSGEKLTLDDFMSRDNSGTTLLANLASRQELALVFTADMWVGRVTDMRKLWTSLRQQDRLNINFDKLELAVQQETLRQKAKSGPKVKFK